MIDSIEIGVGLLAVVAALQLLAKRVAVPLPILLVMAGLLLALLPGLPRIQLHPDVVLLFFLPPLVYEAAANISWSDFRRNLRLITLLAFASSPSTQAFLLVGTLFLLPVILMYSGWSYWVFRGKVRRDFGYH